MQGRNSGSEENIHIKPGRPTKDEVDQDGVSRSTRRDSRREGGSQGMTSGGPRAPKSKFDPYDEHFIEEVLVDTLVLLSGSLNGTKSKIPDQKPANVYN